MISRQEYTIRLAHYLSELKKLKSDLNTYIKINKLNNKFMLLQIKEN